VDRVASCTGVLLGLAAGDAIGLPRERLSRRRADRLQGGTPLRHRFICGRGLTSDDTEHACMTAQSLMASGGEPELFARSLAWRLRFWFLGLPAGLGWATLRACGKLCVGFSPERSGVFSAGNGPAMRAPVLGVYESQDLDRLKALVRASTQLTHTDPRAEAGALAVALAAAYGTREGPAGVRDAERFFAALRPHLRDDELLGHLRRAEEFLARGASVAEFVDALGLKDGVTGYIHHTVPVALYAWLRLPEDFRAAVESVVVLGGDTDTTGAIVGGLSGATLGPGAIPREWLDGLREWPRTVAWLRGLGEALAAAKPGAPVRLPRLFWPALELRNLLFLGVVLLHGFRRLLPPY
jgi:ADP-ribosyl-[dinitrogen reductase] hydrolase